MATRNNTAQIPYVKYLELLSIETAHPLTMNGEGCYGCLISMTTTAQNVLSKLNSTYLGKDSQCSTDGPWC